MLLAAENNYPLLEVIWTIIVFFAWVIWIWTVISVLSDVFRRHDLSGAGQGRLDLPVILLPFLGVLIYLISQGQRMAERNVERCTRHAEDVRAAHPRGRGQGRRRGRRDRRRQGTARQRRHHPGGVRAAQAQGPRLERALPGVASRSAGAADAICQWACQLSPARHDSRANAGLHVTACSSPARGARRAPGWCAGTG